MISWLHISKIAHLCRACPAMFHNQPGQALGEGPQYAHNVCVIDDTVLYYSTNHEYSMKVTRVMHAASMLLQLCSYKGRRPGIEPFLGIHSQIHSFMALGRARARATALPVMPA